MSSSSPRLYDLTILGATGFTGKLAAKYIATRLPTDLRWAIAGRSETKLSAIRKDLQSLDANRVQPSIEVVNLKSDELATLARKTKVILNTVGPYHLYSTPVVEACANNGTHYLDVTGEFPWTMDMIKRFHSTAKSNNAILISQIGIESAPSDLVTFALAKLIKESLDSQTGEVIATVHNMKGTPSGGTLSTVLTIGDSYPISVIQKVHRGDWSSSPVPHPRSTSSPTLLQKSLRQFTGVRTVPDLGTITTSPTGGINRGVVQRTWGLLDDGKYYGPNFTYNEYVTVRNRFVGILFHFALAFGMLALAISPIRAILRRLVTAPGQGPNEASAAKEAFDFRAVAKADRDGRRALGQFRYNGGMYDLTATLLVEAGMVLAKDEEAVRRLGGGYLTPATLGQHLIDRLANGGVELNVTLSPA